MAQALFDALSLPANTPSTAPKLIFSLLEDGTIYYPALTQSTTRYYYSHAAGLDSLGFGAANLGTALNCTGGYLRQEFTLAGADAYSVPAGGDIVAGNVADVAPVWDLTYVANDTNRGIGKKVVLKQLKRSYQEWVGSLIPQCWLQINRNTFTDRMPPVCYRFKMRLPSNMVDVLGGLPGFNAWFEVFAIKSNNTNALTDSRLSLQLIRPAGEDDIRLRLQFDLFLKLLDGTTITSQSNLWQEITPANAMTPGNWYEIYLYVDHAATNTDLTGVTQLLIVDATTDQVVHAKTVTGVPTKGFYNYEQGRIYLRGCYSGGFPSTGNIQLEYSDVMFFDKPPIFIGDVTTS